MTTFKAIWPITDPRRTLDQLAAAATPEIPLLARRARARLTSRGRFTIARSVDIPGSGRATPTVLVYEAAATPITVPRAYWHDHQSTTNQEAGTA